MNQLFSSGKHPKANSIKRRFLKQSLSLISGFSILSSGLGWTQAIASTDDLVIPDTAAPAPKFEAAPLSPVKVPKASAYQNFNSSPATKPVLSDTFTKPDVPKVSPKPSGFQQSVAPTSRVKLAAPRILPPTAPKANNPVPLTESAAPISPQTIQIAPSGISQGKNSYIDTTSYGGSPSKVILTERSTGCQTVSQNGQLFQGSCGRVAKAQPTPRYNEAFTPRRVNLATRHVASPAQVAQAYPSAGMVQRSPVTIQPLRLKSQPITSDQVVSLQPVTRQGLSIGLEPVPRYNRSASLYAPYQGQNAPQTQAKTDLIYPVPIVASITSAFGWRVHPIAGTGRMHQGTDIGAPLGTPVLAAYPGEVATADWSGGYGLMVVLRHLEGTQESRYAHLSEVYVQQGETVEQGTVIGRVGSTGYSTGPHLHFEWRHLTEQGWVAVDAGVHLEYALDNLMRSMQLAQQTPKSEG
jgi:murein DD-endopeptidase MepM/ murein hydrolase activator NlpD